MGEVPAAILLARRARALVLGAAVAAASPSLAERIPDAVAIDPVVTLEGGRTRVALTLSRPVPATASVLDRPERIVIELPGTRCGFGQEDRRRAGLVAGLRCGLGAPGRSRLVLDLAAPALPGAVATRDGFQPGTTLLTVDLTRAERETFRQATLLDAPDRVATTGSLSAEPSDRRPLVALDAGHGGTDPGARASDGTAEKDITLAFTTELHRRLAESGRYRLLLIRPDDVFVPLDDRVRRAREAGAALFVSIHADQIANALVGGATIYTGAERATDAASADLAERENAADAAGEASGAAPPGEIGGILHDLTSRETRGASLRAGGQILKEVGYVARLSAHPRREAGFRVLRNHDLPSVLVELGYMSNARDLDRLTSAAWRSKTAAAMALALDRFFGPPPATTLARAPIAP